MKVFLDTNIVIDFYDQRGEFYYPAAVIFDLAHKGKIQLYVSAITFVNAFFILRKSYSREELYQSMLGLASLCEITDVDSVYHLSVKILRIACNMSLLCSIK